MNKKLPKVFANLNVKKSNNEKVYHLVDKKEETVKPLSKQYDKTVQQKIKDVFNSNNYVYKVDVEITTKDGVSKKRIVGKNKNYIITIDNELIPIAQIEDIKLTKFE